MLCYKDKTFCNSDCIKTDCYRFFGTQEQMEAAEMNLPVALADFRENCSEYISMEIIKKGE